MNLFNPRLLSNKKVYFMKRMIYKKTLMATVVATLSIMAPNCINYPKNDWIMEVSDKKRDWDSWDLEYDYKGRLIRYGDTPVTYGQNLVTIGTIRGDEAGKTMYSATFEFSKGRALRSKSYYYWDIDSILTEVYKQTEYEWKGDTLVMSSVYRSIKNETLLRKAVAQYVFDTDNRLMEVLTTWLDDGKESACHSYFGYGNNIHYVANLNLQAYFVDKDDWDTFFFFLLDMSGREKSTALPIRIRHCVNHGKATYEAEGLYRLEGECPVMMEIISDEIQLKARYEFKYYD